MRCLEPIPKGDLPNGYESSRWGVVNPLAPALGWGENVAIDGQLKLRGPRTVGSVINGLFSSVWVHSFLLYSSLLSSYHLSVFKAVANFYRGEKDVDKIWNPAKDSDFVGDCRKCPREALIGFEKKSGGSGSEWKALWSGPFCHTGITGMGGMVYDKNGGDEFLRPGASKWGGGGVF